MRLIFLFIVTIISLTLHAQQSTLSTNEKSALIDSIALRLQQYYVFPDKAKAIGDHLKKRDGENAYASITNYPDFVTALKKDMQSVHVDKHMGVLFSPEQASQLKMRVAIAAPTPAMMEEERKRERSANFGFVKVEVLPGNVGYIDLRQFFRVSEESENTVAAAMNFISNSDAVIIDLRKNGGGDPRMVQLIVSYFLDKPVHYNSIYNRLSDQTDDFYSLEKVKGKKMPNTPVYILTSNYTFSGAEEFSYNLKNLKRATIVGEVTGGGAHPTTRFVANDNVVIAIPIARAISPITKTNWEGTGVQPDIAIAENKALTKARHLIFQQMSAAAKTPKEKMMADWQLLSVTAELNPVKVDEKLKKELTGNYGDRNITLENGELYYQRGDRQKTKLTPLTETVYKVEGLEYFRVRFERNSSGQIEKLVGLYDNGISDESIKTTKSF